MISVQFLVAVLTFGAVEKAAAEVVAKKPDSLAVASIQGSGGKIEGNVTFSHGPCGGDVYIEAFITGLAPGEYGLHIHERGDLTNGCASTGGIYNPNKVDTSEDDEKPLGDLGNVKANKSGIVVTNFTNKFIQLTGERAIIGRGLVIHDVSDGLDRKLRPDLKKIRYYDDRAGCGVIGLNSCDTIHGWRNVFFIVVIGMILKAFD